MRNRRNKWAAGKSLSFYFIFFRFSSPLCHHASVLEDPEQDIQFANLFAVALGLSLIYPNRLD